MEIIDLDFTDEVRVPDGAGDGDVLPD